MNEIVEAVEAAPTRSGFVALIGATNAGKSTLVNRLVGAKVSIVSHKVQTTRAIIRGIAIEDRTQIVFMDTPGIFKPRRRLDRAMVTTAWGGAKDADIIALLIDSERGIKGDAEKILEALKDVKQPKILILNKIDTVPHEMLLALTAAANQAVNFDATFMISALKGPGCDDLMKYLATTLPEGPWYYPEDQISDLPMRRDAKTELQEWAHQKFGFAPNYRVEDRSGPDHAPEFTVVVEIAGIPPESGSDRSKRAAEQVAAERMLLREGVWKIQTQVTSED